jgi:hypothetical protein
MPAIMGPTVRVFNVGLMARETRKWWTVWSWHMSIDLVKCPLLRSPQDSRQEVLDSLEAVERFSLAPSDGERAGVRGFRGLSVSYAAARSVMLLSKSVKIDLARVGIDSVAGPGQALDPVAVAGVVTAPTGREARVVDRGERPLILLRNVSGLSGEAKLETTALSAEGRSVSPPRLLGGVATQIFCRRYRSYRWWATALRLFCVKVLRVIAKMSLGKVRSGDFPISRWVTSHPDGRAVRRAAVLIGKAVRKLAPKPVRTDSTPSHLKVRHHDVLQLLDPNVRPFL